MFVKALFIAFSMYSRIPVPKTEWNENNMKYVFCFFPLIGVIIGGIVWIVGNFLINTQCGSLLFGCMMSVIPVFITGGIHLDGFLDTLDGLKSYGDKEKKLEILKDPNSGAFAIIGGIVYFILFVGFWSEVNGKALDIIPFGYVLSRAFCGIGAVLFPPAKKTGLAAAFREGADKLKVTVTMIIYIVVDLVLVLCIDFIGGIVMFLSAILCFLYHYFNCIKNFGGITGDLSGYFLQVCELIFLIVITVFRGSLI